MKPFSKYSIFLIFGLLPACSSSVGVFVPKNDSAQPTVYQYGHPILESEHTTKISLTLLEQRAQQALYQIEIHNLSDKEMFFSPASIRIDLISLEKAAAAVKIFHYEELVAQGDSSFAWNGASIVAGSASSAIPGGGVLASAAGRLVNLGLNESKKASANKNLAVLNVKDSYLRRHTLSPDTSYRGVIKVELPRDPEHEDQLQVTVDTGIDTHSFEYRFQETT